MNKHWIQTACPASRNGLFGFKVFLIKQGLANHCCQDLCLTRGSLNHLIIFQHLATVCCGGETQCLPWLHVHLNTHWTFPCFIAVVNVAVCEECSCLQRRSGSNGEERLELLRWCLQGAVGRICEVTICSQTLPSQITAGRAQAAAAACAGNVGLW